MALDIHGQFRDELLRTNLNVAEQDGKPCIQCGKVPKIKKTEKDGKWSVDRSNRVDCDIGEKKEKLETYCKPCWDTLVLKKKIEKKIKKKIKTSP